MSDYDFVSRGSLKLKSNALSGVSKKSKKSKKKDKQEREVEEKVLKQVANEEDQSKPMANASDEGAKSWMTAAERKFLSQQEKRQLARVMSKATKSHKQRVEEFNTHLENLSEHYDIPKVSWTK